MDAWKAQCFLWFCPLVLYKTSHYKHNCSFPLSDIFLKIAFSTINLKSVLCPRRNDLLRGLTSLSLSRMERIPHQVINLNFTLFIRLYDYYKITMFHPFPYLLFETIIILTEVTTSLNSSIVRTPSLLTS